MIDPIANIKALRHAQRSAGALAAANRTRGQRTISGSYEGWDARSGEAIFSTPSGETIRSNAINTAALQPGQSAPLRAAQGGRGISDGKH